MYGWRGAILRIDLSSRTASRDAIDPEILRTCIGGRGLAGFYLFDECTQSWDDPAMPLLLCAGPLVDTPSPASGRMTVMSRSPLTGTVGDASVGGTIGTMIKRAGLDGILITGRSDDLTGIEITDDAVVFTDATALAGMTTGDLTRRLRDRGAVVAVGPAAERGVLFASLIVDGRHAAGRNGIGLSCAAKNVKYITVKGTKRTPVNNPEGLRAAVENIDRLVAASPVLLGEFGIARFGTAALYDITHARSMMPTNNFRETLFPPAPTLNAFRMATDYKPRSFGCRGCTIRCKKISRTGETVLPEFETLSHFTALVGNSDLSIAVEANRLCNELGMDTISTAATLACYGECENRSLVPEEILSLVRDIGEGCGLGAELGSGSLRYARTRGAPDSSMSVKGQELPAYDPRGAFGMALAYAVSSRGGCHLRAYPVAHEMLRKPVATDRFTFAGKGRIIKITEDQNAAADSLTACRFIFFAVSVEEYAPVFAAVTGVAASGHDLLRAGERTCYRERIMNARNGFRGTDDDLPLRFFTEAGSAGQEMPPTPLDRGAFLDARSNYFAARGLDEQGMPLRDKALALGLRLELPWNH